MSLLSRRWIKLASAALCAAVTWLQMAPAAGASSGAAADCRLCAIAERIERGPIEEVVRGLSGADSVTVGGARRLIRSRSNWHADKEVAREYLFEQARGLGYDPELRWFRLRVDVPHLMGAAAAPGGDTLWTAAYEGEIKLITAGDGWRTPTLSGQVNAYLNTLSFDHHGVLWAAGRTKAYGPAYGVLYYSVDRGATWRSFLIGSAAVPVQLFTCLAFGGPETAVAAGSGGTLVAMRRVGGVWEYDRVDPVVLGHIGINGASASGPRHFWAAADAGRLFESSDGGETWQTHTPTQRRLWDIDFFDAERGVIVGERIILHTSDGGQTWNEVLDMPSLQAVVMLDSLSVLAAGREGVIIRSEDGGASWAPFHTACERTKDIGHLVLERQPRRAWAVGRDEVLVFDPGDAGAACAATSLADTIMGANIVFSRAGTVDEGRRVVLCAHYDAFNSSDKYFAPGADDNASGTAAVLETARALRATLLERTIEFIFFDAEEVGLLGSWHHVRNLPQGTSVEAVINLDMIGRDYSGGRRMDIGARSAGPDTELVDLIGAMVGFLGLDLEPNLLTDRSPTSDHKPFWELAGVPAVLLIEGEYWNNPHYHRGSDVAAHIDFDYVTDIARTAVASAAHLAGLIAVEEPREPPAAVVLLQNFPNPMWGHTTIAWSLPARMFLRIGVYDVSGRLVHTALSGEREAGPGSVVWYGRNDAGRPVASGIYFLRLEAGGASRTRKIINLR